MECVCERVSVAPYMYPWSYAHARITSTCLMFVACVSCVLAYVRCICAVSVCGWLPTVFSRDISMRSMHHYSALSCTSYAVWLGLYVCWGVYVESTNCHTLWLLKAFGIMFDQLQPSHISLRLLYVIGRQFMCVIVHHAYVHVYMYLYILTCSHRNWPSCKSPF